MHGFSRNCPSANDGISHNSTLTTWLLLLAPLKPNAPTSLLEKNIVPCDLRPSPWHEDLETLRQWRLGTGQHHGTMTSAQLQPGWDPSSSRAAVCRGCAVPTSTQTERMSSCMTIHLRFRLHSLEVLLGIGVSELELKEERT